MELVAPNTHSCTVPLSDAADLLSPSRPSPGPSSVQVTPSKLDFSSSAAYHTPSQPRDSWETAYVFAFILKFTNLCHDLKTGLRLQTAHDFERILEVDTRIAPSELTTESDNSLSEAKQVLTEILSTFHENLKNANTMLWPRWLKSYVEDLVKYELKKPMLATLKWDQNHLKTENGFWDLDWLQKVHLLRILVDHQLSHSAKIKSMIDENYEKAHSKPPKQPVIPTSKMDIKPFQNPLIIKPLGIDRQLKTWWQIDDSPRIYGSGNPYKLNCTWTVLSTSQSEFIQVSNKLSSDPNNPQVQPFNSMLPTSDSCQSNESSTRKVTIPSMFTVNRKKPSGNSAVNHDHLLKLEWELSKAINNVAKPNIETGEQRIQGLLREKARLEEIEAKKQQKLLLANASKRDPDFTRSTTGYGVRSRLRSQVSKPDYVVDSDLIDRKLERALQEHERSKPDGADTNKRVKVNKRKRKGRSRDSADSDSEDSDYQAGQDDSVAGTNDDEDTLGIEEASNEFGRPSRKRNYGSKKASTSQGERRSLRVRTKTETEVEDESKQSIIEEESQPSASTWSRSKAPMSPSISEPMEESSVAPVELIENVSVWSRGKLVYVAGNNKYASKPVALPQKKKSYARQGSGVVTKSPCMGNAALVGIQPSSTLADSLSALQTRLAAMAGADDDDESIDDTEMAEKENKSTIHHHELNTKVIEQEAQLSGSLKSLKTGDDRQGEVEDRLIDSGVRLFPKKIDGMEEEEEEEINDKQTLVVSPPSSLVELLNEQPLRIQTNPNPISIEISADLSTKNTTTNSSDHIQHLQAQYLPSVV